MFTGPDRSLLSGSNFQGLHRNSRELTHLTEIFLVKHGSKYKQEHVTSAVVSNQRYKYKGKNTYRAMIKTKDEDGLDIERYETCAFQTVEEALKQLMTLAKYGPQLRVILAKEPQNLMEKVLHKMMRDLHL